MKKLALLDNNIWSYIADRNLADQLIRHLKSADHTIAVAPAVLYEALRTPNESVRQKLVSLMCLARWQRLMPEAYSECAEIVREVTRLHPEWISSKGGLRNYRILKRDWRRKTGGFWDRARYDAAGEANKITAWGGDALAEARALARANRQRAVKGKASPREPLAGLRCIPAFPMPGWEGAPVEPWRVAAAAGFIQALATAEHPYLDWLSGCLDLEDIEVADWVRFWLYEVTLTHVPRHWIRWAFEHLSSLAKVTDGTPCDVQLATHSVECDLVVSSDGVFIEIISRIKDEAAFTVARGKHIDARGGFQSELFDCL